MFAPFLMVPTQDHRPCDGKSMQDGWLISRKAKYRLGVVLNSGGGVVPHRGGSGSECSDSTERSNRYERGYQTIFDGGGGALVTD